MRISDWSSDVCSSDLDDSFCGMCARSIRHADAPSRRGRSYCRCGCATNSLPRRLHLGQQRVQHLVGILAFDLQLRRQRDAVAQRGLGDVRSEEHTSELQSLMRISYAVFCLKKKK